MAPACRASAPASPTPRQPCRHTALQGGGKWRETDKPRSRGSVPLCPLAVGRAGGGARPCRLRAGPADMAAPGLGLVAFHRPGVQPPAGPACPTGPHSPGLGVPGSHPGAVDPRISPSSDLSPGPPWQAPGRPCPSACEQTPGHTGPSRRRGRKRRLAAWCAEGCSQRSMAATETIYFMSRGCVASRVNTSRRNAEQFNFTH